MGEVETEGLNDRAAGCRCSSDLPARLANVSGGACDHRRGLPAADRQRSGGAAQLLEGAGGGSA